MAHDCFVIDNVLSEEEANEIIDGIFFNNKLHFFYCNDITDYRKRKLSNNKFGFGITLDENVFNDIVELAAAKVDMKVNHVLNTRVFMTTPIVDDDRVGTPHVDRQTPHFVCLYYVNDSDGDTVFFEDENSDNIIHRVSPKKNRAILFKGHLYHAATWPSKSPRCTININWV